jgi:hypothetical protein
MRAVINKNGSLSLSPDSDVERWWIAQVLKKVPVWGKTTVSFGDDKFPLIEFVE